MIGVTFSIFPRGNFLAAFLTQLDFHRDQVQQELRPVSGNGLVQEIFDPRFLADPPTPLESVAGLGQSDRLLSVHQQILNATPRRYSMKAPFPYCESRAVCGISR